MAEDKARDRVESRDSGRECNAVIRPQGPDAARMDFFNGLIGPDGMNRWNNGAIFPGQDANCPFLKSEGLLGGLKYVKTRG